MVTKAQAKYIRISPQKMRLVASVVKGTEIKKALSVLKFLNKKGAFYMEKVLLSAVANAKSKGFEENQLFISKVVINPGPMLKRFRAASFGRAASIRKRTSHILVELDTKEELG